MVGRPRCGGGETLVGTLRVQKGSWARNGPLPLKKRPFLVYSTIAEIRDKFDHRAVLVEDPAVVGGEPAVAAVVGRPRCDGRPGRPHCGWGP